MLKQAEAKTEEKFLKSKRKTSDRGESPVEKNFTKPKKTESKLKSENNNNNINNNNNNNNNNKKVFKKLKKDQVEKKPKQVCQYYINGACSRGKSCGFSHEVEQNKKDDLCKYFMTGACTKGDECLFSHDMSSFPCKFFHALGCCVNGDNCKFSHQRLSESEIFSFIVQNEDFLVHLYKTMGRTNMDDYLLKYLEDKNRNAKFPSNETIMLPQSLIGENNLTQNQNFAGKNLRLFNQSNMMPNFLQMMQFMQMNNILARNMPVNQFANNQHKIIPNQVLQPEGIKFNPQMLMNSQNIMNLALKANNSQQLNLNSFNSLNSFNKTKHCQIESK
jgi:hypothetical protein